MVIFTNPNQRTLGAKIAALSLMRAEKEFRLQPQSTRRHSELLENIIWSFEAFLPKVEIINHEEVSESAARIDGVGQIVKVWGVLVKDRTVLFRCRVGEEDKDIPSTDIEPELHITLASVAICKKLAEAPEPSILQPIG